MKKAKKNIIAGLMACVLLATSTSVSFAASNEEATPYASTTQSETKQDKDGNSWKISRKSYATAKTAYVQTTVKLQNVKDGTEETQEELLTMPKTISHSATVNMNTGSEDTTHLTTSASGWHSESKTINSSYQYLYMIMGVVATHNFSCNGLSYSKTSVWYYGK